MKAVIVRTGTALLLLAGCAGTGEVGAEARDSGTGVAAPAPTAATDCGKFEKRPDTAGVSPQGVHCVQDALRTKRPARVALTVYSTEGDPVYVTVTTRTDGRAEVVTDLRKDRFAGRGNRVQRELCTGLRPANGLLMFAECSPPRPASAPDGG